MSAEKTEAVILSVAPYKEASCILRLYTNTRGLIHGIAKGARKTPKSTPLDRGFLMEALVYYKPNRELHTIGSSHIINFFPLIRSDIAKSAVRDIALELYLKTIPQSDPHPELFELIADFLAGMEESSDKELLFPFLWRFICRYCLLTGFGMDAKSYRLCGIDGNIIKFIENDDTPPFPRVKDYLQITESILQYCIIHFDIRAPFKSFEFIRTTLPAFSS
jgi:DNA repair protein RecO